jgi:oligoribonuclease (3'-5' exoribonuclease)
MTGLDINEDHILDFDCIVTDRNMSQLAEYHPVIHQSKEVLESMGDWCRMTYTQSGLLNLVRKSSDTYITVEEEIIKLLKKYPSKNNTSIYKSNTHTAINGIKDSIAEHLYYEKILFKRD